MTTAQPGFAGAASGAHGAAGVGEIVWTVVVAGGSGARFGRAKQYEALGASRVLDRSVGVAAAASVGVVVVVPVADVESERRVFDHVVAGGASRSESVRAGLAAVPPDATVVCVHDAARPFASPQLYARVVAAVTAGADGAIPGIAVTDTIKVVDADGAVLATPARDSLRAVQTPQAFRAEVLRRAHASGGEGTDDAALVESAGGRVVVVDGEADNRKITHPADLDWARQRVQEGAS
ncbi:MAG: 2-C-methyl-D-erythritol 4-phosphate cytidylyltransferase [Acidimicrobiales bacterium]